ncbi:unnamed protein product [Calypogeia fissa]
MSTTNLDENSSNDNFEAWFGQSQNRPNIPDGERVILPSSTKTMGQVARHWRREKDYRFIPSLAGRTLEEGQKVGPSEACRQLSRFPILHDPQESPIQFDDVLDSLVKEVSSGVVAAEYIRDIDPALYTRYTFPLPQHGQVTSNPYVVDIAQGSTLQQSKSYGLGTERHSGEDVYDRETPDVTPEEPEDAYYPHREVYDTEPDDDEQEAQLLGWRLGTTQEPCGPHGWHTGYPIFNNM